MTKQYVTPVQFNKVILRMMPKWASEMPEGKLVAAVLTNAFDKADEPSNIFFRNETGWLKMYCSLVGLEWTQIQYIYENHCRKGKSRISSEKKVLA